MGLFNATTSYGKGFKATKNPGEFSIKIYTGGSAGRHEAMKKVQMDIQAFMEKKSFTQFEILSSRFNFIPSFFKFVVRFS